MKKMIKISFFSILTTVIIFFGALVICKRFYEKEISLAMILLWTNTAVLALATFLTVGSILFEKWQGESAAALTSTISLAMILGGFIPGAYLWASLMSVGALGRGYGYAKANNIKFPSIIGVLACQHVLGIGAIGWLSRIFQ